MKAKTRERIGKWGMNIGAVILIGAVTVPTTRVLVWHVQTASFTLPLVVSLAITAGVLMLIPRLFRGVEYDC